VTLCSTTSGEAAGKVARTLTRVGASWGMSSSPRPSMAVKPANRMSRLQTMVRTGLRRNGWESDRTDGTQLAGESWQQKTPG
jgi:hypothetical protein